jgi:hypothetical protein
VTSSTRRPHAAAARAAAMPAAPEPTTTMSVSLSHTGDVHGRYRTSAPAGPFIAHPR